MQSSRLNRRRFLLSSATVGAVGLTVGTGNAWAFSEEQMDVKTEGLAFGACQAPGGAITYHRQLLADITAALQGKPQAEIETQIAAATCPLCGCSLG